MFVKPMSFNHKKSKARFIQIYALTVQPMTVHQLAEQMGIAARRIYPYVHHLSEIGALILASEKQRPCYWVAAEKFDMADIEDAEALMIIAARKKATALKPFRSPLDIAFFGPA